MPLLAGEKQASLSAYLPTRSLPPNRAKFKRFNTAVPTNKCKLQINTLLPLRPSQDRIQHRTRYIHPGTLICCCVFLFDSIVSKVKSLSPRHLFSRGADSYLYSISRFIKPTPPHTVEGPSNDSRGNHDIPTLNAIWIRSSQ